MKTIKLLTIPIAISMLFAFLMYEDISGSTDTLKNSSPQSLKHLEKTMADVPPIPVKNEIIKDTIYVAGDYYITISLKKQLTYLYQRGIDTPTVYKISSGNPRIKSGIETTQGLFSVQTKNPLGHSKQFENAELWNWIGFHGNIGFHGLSGNSYYPHLGVRTSSHGCVRMSREDGKEMYKKVQFGTPVLCYKEEPAVVLAFTSDKVSNTEYMLIPADARTFRQEMQNRINNLYNGVGLIANTSKLLLDGQTVIRWGGYPIGRADSIAYTQKFPIAFINTPAHNADVIYVNKSIIEKKEKKDKDKDEEQEK
ncbi:MAG: L,D-transpeptidase [Ignavibacteria bacterium]|nr:L,D-transpeptidase [Ignavibacteria bacterium]